MHAVSLALLALALSACGGGGTSAQLADGGPPAVPAVPAVPTPVPDPVTPPALSSSALQGIWQSAPGAASSSSAIVLPDGTFWSLLSSGATTRLVKAKLSPAASGQTAGFNGSGSSYTLGSSTVSKLTGTASVIEKSSLSITLTETGTGQQETRTLAYQSRYESKAALGDFAGNWSATLGPGTVSWTITAGGALSGTRTTGCTYSGQLSLRSEAMAVVDVQLAEHCNGALTALQGVATFSADQARLAMLLTTSDQATGVALNLLRQ